MKKGALNMNWQRLLTLVFSIGIATVCASLWSSSILQAQTFAFKRTDFPGGSPSGTSDFIVTADFNGDGIPDVAHTDYSAFNQTVISVYLGKPDGSLGTATVVSVANAGSGWAPVALAAGDFNGDGKIDLAVANIKPPLDAEIVVLLGNGTGSFSMSSSKTTSLPSATVPNQLISADFNGDGKTDVAYVNGLLPQVVIASGDGTGGFATPSSYTTPFSSHFLATGDFNGDGKPDLAVTSDMPSTVSILLNTGNGFSSHSGIVLNSNFSTSTLDVIVSDFNGDKKPDLAVISLSLTDSVYSVIVLLGQGSGGFAAQNPVKLTQANGLAAGDFNGDGKIDLAVTGNGQSSDNTRPGLVILPGDGTGGFLQPLAVDSGNDSLERIVSADFNRDGHPDLACIASAGNFVAVFINTQGQSGGGGGGRAEVNVLIPIVLSSSGAKGSFYTSELTLTNRSSNSVDVSYYYNAAIGTGTGVASETLPPGTQKIYADAIAHLLDLGVPLPASGNRGGTLLIKFAGMSSPQEASATVRTTTVVSNGRAGLAYAGIADSSLLNAPAYLFGLRQNTTDRSNVAFINGGQDSTAGSIQLKVSVISGDPANPKSGETTVTLAPLGFQQISGILATYGMTNGYVRVERVSGTAPFYAYGVVNDQVNSDGSFIPPILDGSLAGIGSMTLPVLVETASYSSELVLANWSNSAKTLKLNFTADPITAPGNTATGSWTLQPGEQVIQPQIIQYWRNQGVTGIGPAGPTFAGALSVSVASGDLNGIAVGARTSTPGGGGEYGLFYTAYPRGHSAQLGAWLYGVQQNAENRTNFAVVNTGEVDNNPISVRIDIFDGDSGNKVGTVDNYPVNAGAWRQINAILSAYAPGTTHGYLHVTRLSGSNPFIVYSVINDGSQAGARSGDGAYVGMAIED